MTSSSERIPSRGARRGFTLVELVIAGIVAALLLTAVTFALSQLGKSRNAARARAEAYQRAATALESVRREVASLLRSDDLFEARFLLEPASARGGPEGSLRSSLLVFNESMRPIRSVEYQGEGREYESHFRVEDDALGSALWNRRDNVPDEYPDGGGVATPVADGVIALSVEASDGQGGWRSEWDSDVDGIPSMVRVEVTATGAELGAEPGEQTPVVVLRTVIPVDRVVAPRGEPEPVPEAAEGAGAAAQDGSGGPQPTGDAGPVGDGGPQPNGDGGPPRGGSGGIGTGGTGTGIPRTPGSGGSGGSSGGGIRPAGTGGRGGGRR